MKEKRSPAGESAQLYLLPGLADEGVGARQTSQPPQAGGGGYLDIRSGPKFGKKTPAAENPAARDPRLDELHHMGLARCWLEVAEAIGADAFLTLWRILDADQANWHNDSILRVRLRPYRSYLRYQRNRFIEALAEQGLRPDEIQRRLRRQFGESVSNRHITRLSRADRLARA